MKKVKNKLQVRHYPQIPCEPFIVNVSDEYEAKKIIDMLADQHLFLYNNNIIGDYSNVFSVVMYNEEEQEWEDYWNENEGMEWDELEETYLQKYFQ